MTDGTEFEDEYEFVSEDDMINYFKKRGKDVVKREDLQILIENCTDNLVYHSRHSPFYDVLERIKEEYNL